MVETPPSLYDLALQQCVRYASLITNIGGIPYSAAKPFLAKLNRDQLAVIESRSPHIMKESDELWRELIIREFRDRVVPSGDFRQTFYQYVRDKEAQLIAARERLKLNQEQYNKSKRASSVVPLSEEELPINQRGPPQPAFRSRTMKSVAKRAQAGMHMWKHQPSSNTLIPSKGKSGIAFGPSKSLTRGLQSPSSMTQRYHSKSQLSMSFSSSSSSLSSAPLSSSPSLPPPSSPSPSSSSALPASQPSSSSSLPLHHGPVSSAGTPLNQLSRHAVISSQPSAKRKRVPSVFMPKR